MAQVAENTEEKIIYNPDIAWIHGQIRDSLDAQRDWRDSARDSFAFYAGKQWTDEDIAIMKDRKQIPIVFNRVTRTINAISGLEVQNRQEIRYIPRTQGDVKVNEVLTQAVDYMRDNTDAGDEESEIFRDCLICGMGFSDTYLDFDDNPEGDLRQTRIDPLEIGWDPKAKKANIADADFIWRAKKISRKEFGQLYPDKSPERWDITFDMDFDQPHDVEEAKYYRKDQGDRITDKNIVIVEFQWREKQTFYQAEISDPNTEEKRFVELKRGQYQQLKAFADMNGLPLRAVKRTKWIYKRAFINGGQILSQKEFKEDQKAFTFKVITGLRDRNDNQWFGIIELMKDPQRWANKWLSQIMFILSTNAKGGLLAEADAFDDIRKAEEQWAAPDKITFTTPGAIAGGKIQEKTMANYPSGIDRLLQYSMEAISDVPGVNAELLGLVNREQPGILEMSRKQAGITILAVFFDALRRYRKTQGRLLAFYVREYLSDGRLIRITLDNKEQFTALTAEAIKGAKDEGTFEFDVVVDDAPTSPNMKERTFGILTQLLGMLPPNALQALPIEALDYTPLPSSFISKWKENMSKPPSQEQQAIMKKNIELELREKEANVAEKASQARLNEARAMTEEIEAGIVKPSKAQLDQSKAREAEVNADVDVLQAQGLISTQV